MRAALTIVVALCPLIAWADEPSEAPEAPPVSDAPTTRPLGGPKRPATTAPAIPPELAARIGELIAQLGHESFEQREAAMGKLGRIGEPARDALKEATGSDDAEIAERAARLLAALEDRPAAGPEDGAIGPGGQIQVVQVGGQGAVSVRVVATDGMKLTSRHDAAGLHVEHVVTDENGKKITTRADVKDMAELKKKHPKLHALVEKHFGAGGQLQLRVQFGPGGVVPGVPRPPRGAPAAMRLAAALARMGLRGSALDAASCGKLQIKAGILVDGAVGAGRGAAALGVRRGDVITAINGRALAGAADAIAASRGPLRSLTVLRGGRQMELTPPPPPTDDPAARPVPAPPARPPIPPLP